MWSRWVISLGVVLIALAWCLAKEPEAVLVSEKASDPKAVTKDKEDTVKEVFSGKVVILQDALKRRGVKTYDEFKSQVVLETDDGELIPIVPDWRGVAFYQDERLRNRRVDLVGMRQKSAPYLQVLMIFVFDDKGTRQYMDYWCDICSIPMYEVKPCDCCQAENRLRFQPQELPSFVKPKTNPQR